MVSGTLAGGDIVCAGPAAGCAAGAGRRLAGKVGGSANVHLVAHVPLGGYFRVTDADLEQELSRPYAYVAQSRERAGFSIVDLKDLNNVKVLYRWKIESVSLHKGLGGLRAKYFKLKGRYYVAECFQFAQGTPDNDLGAIIFDVTGLPDTSKVKVVARIRAPRDAGRLPQPVAYKHSDGRVLLFTTTMSNVANINDMEKVLAGDTAHMLVGKVPAPPTMCVARYPPDSRMCRFSCRDITTSTSATSARGQDKFYGAGGGGWHHR